MVANVHDHKTRASSGGYHISKEDVDGSFVYFGKKEWNAIPDGLKDIGNIDLFKVKLKQYLMQGY